MSTHSSTLISLHTHTQAHTHTHTHTHTHVCVEHSCLRIHLDTGTTCTCVLSGVLTNHGHFTHAIYVHPPTHAYTQWHQHTHLVLSPCTHTTISTASEHNKWGKHQGCVAAARKHGSVLLPTGWCLSLSLSLSLSLILTDSLPQTHTRESVKIPIIRLAFSPSMLGAIIKSGAKFELVSQSVVCRPPTDFAPHYACVCVNAGMQV